MFYNLNLKVVIVQTVTLETFLSYVMGTEIILVKIILSSMSRKLGRIDLTTQKLALILHNWSEIPPLAKEMLPLCGVLIYLCLNQDNLPHTTVRSHRSPNHDQCSSYSFPSCRTCKCPIKPSQPKLLGTCNIWGACQHNRIRQSLTMLRRMDLKKEISALSSCCVSSSPGVRVHFSRSLLAFEIRDYAVFEFAVYKERIQPREDHSLAVSFLQPWSHFSPFQRIPNFQTLKDYNAQDVIKLEQLISVPFLRTILSRRPLVEQSWDLAAGSQSCWLFQCHATAIGGYQVLHSCWIARPLPPETLWKCLALDLLYLPLKTNVESVFNFSFKEKLS